MKSKENLLEQLKSLSHFTKNTVNQLGNQLGLKNSTVNTYISRYLNHKEVFQFKNGLYVTSDFFNKNKSDISYSFYLANILRTPSYVSSWAALQYYNIATESIYSITSVTSKVGRTYQTKAGNFLYQSIQKGLFSNFSLVKAKFDFFIATPSKALFDLLYFKTHQFRGIAHQDVVLLVKEMRIDIDEMSKDEQKKFYAMINKYINE
jgi:predicted transcriptional regulator of viral defense system